MKTFGRVVASLLLGAVPLAGPLQAQEGFRVVVNPANPVTSLKESDLSRLFLKKTTTWPTGAPVVAVDQVRTSPVRRAFSLEVHSKDPDAVVSYWQTLVFSGRDTPPAIKPSDESVLEFVRANPGAIGYVSPGAGVDGVKVVAVQ